MSDLDLETVASALPGYEVGGEIGRGAWGVVIAGTHRQLGRKVAIKQLPRAFGADESVRSRFVTEARLLASLDHPHIVPVFDYVEKDGLCLLVMEWLPGGTVWDRFTSAGVTAEAACALVMAACAGLHFAHKRGVLHRDVKPENLIFNSEGILKVSDFGIAKVITGAEAAATRAGEVLGTPAYMAPEQARGSELGPYTDVYALGTMLYELLCGQLPFPEGNDPLALMFQHVHEEPVPLQSVAPQISDDLSAVTMRSLSTSPADRHATAEEFGVAVAESATATWGPEWLERADLVIISAGPIMAAVQRPTTPTASAGAAPTPTASAGAAPTPTAKTSAVPAEPTGRTAKTRAVPAGASGAREIDRTRAVPAAASGQREIDRTRSVQAPAAPVRATALVRPQGVSALDRRPEDMVPLKEVVRLPPPPRIHIAVAMLLSIAVVAVAFSGVGSPSLESDLPAGAITIAGADLASGDGVDMDLSRPLELNTSIVPGGATDVRLIFSIAGFPIRSFQAPLEPSGAGATGAGATASIDAGSARFLIASETTAELRFLANASAVQSEKFAARTKQPFYLTAPGVAGIGLALFVFAYVEALLRPMRRGKKQFSGLAGLLILGAAGGVAIHIIVWLTTGTQPSLVSLIACAGCGAGAGVAAALGAIRAGKRRRMRRRKPAAPRAA